MRSNFENLEIFQIVHAKGRGRRGPGLKSPQRFKSSFFGWVDLSNWVMCSAKHTFRTRGRGRFENQFMRCWCCRLYFRWHVQFVDFIVVFVVYIGCVSIGSIG